MSDRITEVYRIFLSSTAIDLQEHRRKVSDAIMRLGDLPVGMEQFGALPSDPVDVCQRKARQCDALVVMVAHRYGWVPGVDEGGDGHKSITWLEVEAALGAGKPIFAFLVDPTFGWSAAKEQDLLSEADDDAEALKIYKKVQALKDFRTFLEREAGLTRDTFTTPDDLAVKVATSLANWARQGERRPAEPTRRSYEFRVVHPLQPAPHFRGRKTLLANLHRWWKDVADPDRVRSLVAIGGAGKTAVVERFLDEIKDEPLRGSVLVWSFYEEPNTDAFLRAACVVFAGEEGEGAGGRLERLQRALAGSEPHLLVLDGLERVQSPGKGGRARGELEDHQLKNVLRSIAGGLGRTRAVVTSRFKLTDLELWEGAGCRTHALDVLDKPSAVGVLEAWGVRGEDEQLLALAEQVGYHALSVSVLGSYLHHFCDGDPNAAEGLKLDEISADDPQAAKLSRILAGYARDLPDAERDLLIRLSVFPRGVSIEVLGYLIDAGGDIAGTLIGANQATLAQLAQRLTDMGLVFRYQRGDRITYTAHPFLRDYFRDLLGVPSEQIHAVVRSKLAGGLDARPETKPREPKMLDRYEALIEHTILAGRVQEAAELYYHGLGGPPWDVHLYHVLADYGRMARILTAFARGGEPEDLAPELQARERASLMNDWGLAAEALGNLPLAEHCFGVATGLDREAGAYKSVSLDLINSAWVARARGAFPSARRHLVESLELAEPDDEYVRQANHSHLAWACHALGEISQAQKHFASTREYDVIVRGTEEPEHLMALGQLEAAREHAWVCLSRSQEEESPQDQSLCHCVLGVLCLPDDVGGARNHLKEVREWTAQTGHMECIIRGHILAAEIGRSTNDLPG